MIFLYFTAIIQRFPITLIVDFIMKKLTTAIVATFPLLLTLVSLPSCSKNEFDPSDSISSLLTGEYGKGKFWKLTTTINGDFITSDGYVRFDSKYQAEDADFRFVNVIPGESSKEFKHIPLTSAEDGLAFNIDYNHKSGNVHIVGIVTFGEMTVNMTMPE